jgi:hypothetical protein
MTEVANARTEMMTALRFRFVMRYLLKLDLKPLAIQNPA